MLYYLLLTDLICFFAACLFSSTMVRSFSFAIRITFLAVIQRRFHQLAFGNNYFSVFNTSYRFYNDKLIFRDIELIWIKVIYLSGLLKANTYYIIQNGHPSCNRNTNCSNTSCAFTLALILFLPLIY